MEPTDYTPTDVEVSMSRLDAMVGASDGSILVRCGSISAPADAWNVRIVLAELRRLRAGAPSATDTRALALAHAVQWSPDTIAMVELEALDPDDVIEVEAAYRQAARAHHPDHGGQPQMMAYLNTARAELVEGHHGS